MSSTPLPPGLFKSPLHERNYMAAYDRTLAQWPIPYESRFVETSYGTTHVIVSGPEAGEPLLLLNGFGFSATMWYPNVETLSADCRVYAVDVIGEFNRSAANRDFRERLDYANWLSELMDGLGLARAAFVGHSNGGWHTLNFAIRYPQRVAKMVLLAPAASFAPFAKQFGIRLLAANLIRTRKVVIDFCAKWFIAKENVDRVHPALLEQFYRGIVGFGWKHKILIPTVFGDEELRGIKAPVLLVIGDKEVIYNPKRVFARAQALIPRVRTRSIPGAGHAVNLEKADLVNLDMLAFLRNVRE